MDWATLAWAPYAGPLSSAQAPHVPLLRSALEEAASAHVSAPVTLRALRVAAHRCEPDAAVTEGGWQLDETAFLPVASFELLGAPRRVAWAALDPAASTTLAGVPADADRLAGALAAALDEALGAALGEGLSLGPGDRAAPEPGTELLLVRLELTSGEAQPCGLVLAVPATVEAELLAHLAALQALSDTPDADAPATAAPIATPPVPASAIAPTAAGPSASAVARAPASDPVPAARGAAAGPTRLAGGAEDSLPPSRAAEPPIVRNAAFDQLSPRPVEQPAANIDLLLGVNLEVTVEIGRTRLPIRDILALAPGSIVELDKLAGEQVDVLVNGHPIAQGEVVVVDENFGVRVMTIVSRHGRIASAGVA